MSSKNKNDAVPLDDPSLYANTFSFLGLPLDRSIDHVELDAVVMGIPYDLGTTGRSGARGGPASIRQASANLRWEEQRWPWDFRLSERLSAIDYGDVQFSSGNSEQMLAEVEAHASRIVSAGKTLVSLGGDHLVTLPLLRAHAATHGKLALIHFDAHTDTYGDHEKYDHGSMFHHAPEEGLVDPAQSIQIGIRTEHDLATHSYQVVNADDANERSADDIVQMIRSRVGDMPAYLTFDIDCLDPAFAPGTGTPVVGGLSTGKALRIVRGLADINIVGFDVVEVLPAHDSEQITALAAATLALEFLHLRASQR